MSNALKALLISVAVIELGFLIAGDRVDLFIYRAVHLLQMVVLIAVVAVKAPRSGVFWLILLALASAFCGDIINSGLIDLTAFHQQQTLLSIPFFFVTHLLYVAVFWRLLSITMVPRVFVALILAAVLLQLFGPDVGIVAMVGVAVYGVTLLTMALVAASFFTQPGHARWVAISAWVFVVSDCLIASTLFSGAERTLYLNAAIWLTYIGAQIGIASVLLLPNRATQAQAVA